MGNGPVDVDDHAALNALPAHQRLFASIPVAMWTLLSSTLSSEFPDEFHEFDEGGGAPLWTRCVYTAHILSSNTFILSMLVGLICEIVTAVGGAQKERISIQNAKMELRKHFDACDEDSDGRIDPDEFLTLLSKEAVTEVLTGMDIDVIHWINAADYLFEGKETITFGKFLEAALSLRASNRATVADVVDIRKLIQRNDDRAEERFVALADSMRMIEDRLAEIRAGTGNSEPAPASRNRISPKS